MKYGVWNQTSWNKQKKKSVENYRSNLKLKWNQQQQKKKSHWFWWTLEFHKALHAMCQTAQKMIFCMPVNLLSHRDRAFADTAVGME